MTFKREHRKLEPRKARQRDTPIRTSLQGVAMTGRDDERGGIAACGPLEGRRYIPVAQGIMDKHNALIVPMDAKALSMMDQLMLAEMARKLGIAIKK